MFISERKKKSFIRIYSKNSCFQKTKFSKQKQKLRNNTKEPVNHKVGSNIEFRCMYTNLKPYMSRSQVDTDPTQTRAGPPITFLVSTFGITYILWAHLTIFIELSGFHLRSRVKKLFFIRNENKWWRTQRRTWNNIFFSSLSHEGFHRGMKMVKRKFIFLVFRLAKHSLNHSSSNHLRNLSKIKISKKWDPWCISVQSLAIWWPSLPFSSFISSWLTKQNQT